MWINRHLCPFGYSSLAVSRLTRLVGHTQPAQLAHGSPQCQTVCDMLTDTVTEGEADGL